MMFVLSHEAMRHALHKIAGETAGAVAADLVEMAAEDPAEVEQLPEQELNDTDHAEDQSTDESIIEARRAYHREYRKKNGDRIRERERKWRRDNPDRVKAIQRRFWEKRKRENAAAAGKEA